MLYIISIGPSGANNLCFQKHLVTRGTQRAHSHLKTMIFHAVILKSPASGEVMRMNFELPGSRLGVAWKSPGSLGEVGIQVARKSPASLPSECALLGNLNLFAS